MKRPKRIGTILKAILGRMGMARIIGEGQLKNCWLEIVGREIARHSRPQGIRGKRLFIVVDSATWLQQLSLMKRELMEKINHRFGEKLVGEIYLRQGELEEEEENREGEGKRTLEKVALKEEELREIEGIVSPLREKSVRDSLRRLMIVERKFKKLL